MYYSQQSGNPGERIKQFFTGKSMLASFIIVNLAVFLAVNFMRVIFFLFNIDPFISEEIPVNKIVFWFSVPADLNALLGRPWTLFTYMFLQEEFLHLFFNMLMLYIGGEIFVRFLGERRLLKVYLMGGLFGAFFYIASFNLFPVFENAVSYSIALGASASVLAVLVAIATYKPDYYLNIFLLGRIKLKYIALALVIIDILSIDQGNAGGHLAHLGGAFWGYLHMLRMKDNAGKKRSFLDSLFDLFKRKPQYTRFTTIKNDRGRPMTDEEYNERRVKQQEKIDEILEKISKSGYASLTKQEKELLFSFGNKK